MTRAEQHYLAHTDTARTAAAAWRAGVAIAPASSRGSAQFAESLVRDVERVAQRHDAWES